MAAWTEDDIPDQTGRTAIVTGANTGIGFETARALAQKGAAVTLACRNPEKGKDAVERIRALQPSGSVELRVLDLSDLQSVSSFSEAYVADHERLDLLILNAGVMVPPKSETAQGFELQFGVNHLSHFALTGQLLPLVQRTPEARVVVVSSTAASFGTMNFEDLQFAERGYQAWPAYGQSKLANQLFTRELQRRLQGAGETALVTAAHPGWTATDLQRSSGLASFFNPFFAQKPPMGALPTLRAATDPDAAAASYYGPRGIGQMRGAPVVVPMVRAASKDADAVQLWEVSEELTGVRYDLVRS
ncbi:MAG: SDR family oxidoreductase [Myxococcales bacterium]|nr:SDR family oxidoreductase [Myxococcales bacterium]